MSFRDRNARLATAMILWGAVTSVLLLRPLSGQIAKPRTADETIYAVWAQRWASFAEEAQVAKRLGLSVEQYRARLERNAWWHQTPPALVSRHQDWQTPVGFGTGNARHYSTSDFMAGFDGERPVVETRVEITADRNHLHFRYWCGEPHLELVTGHSETRLNPFAREVLQGDVAALYQRQRALGRESIIGRIQAVAPRSRSVFQDDCVFVRLTPLSTGQDLAGAFRVRDQRGARELLDASPMASNGKLQLKGTFYTIAANAAGELHSSFYEPSEGGRFWCNWTPQAQVTTARTHEAWIVEWSIPLEHLQPILSRGAIWGVDLYRHRPARANAPAQLMRSRKTLFLRYDGDGKALEARLRAAGVDEASISKWSAISERTAGERPEATVHFVSTPLGPKDWPDSRQWQDATTLSPLRKLTTGRPATAETRVRMLCTRVEWFIRFDCPRPPGRPLRLVGREEELAAFPQGHRAVEWLDRREFFGGPDWGDHIEIQFAPGLGKDDPFHAGYYLLLLNSAGTLQCRYYDPCGNFSLREFGWQQHVRVKTTTHKSGWTAQFAIPFLEVATAPSTTRVWHANFFQHAGRTPESSLAWSPTFGPYREPGSMGRIHFPHRIARSGQSPRWIPGSRKGGPASSPVVDRSRDRVNAIAWRGDHVIGVGNRGTVWRDDTGAEWNPTASATDANLEAVCFVDADHGWAVGGQPRDARLAICGGMGVILSTSDGGRSWQTQWQHKGEWLYDVCFVNRHVGYACGGYGIVLKTTDGGQTWNGPLPTGTNAWLYGITFVDAAVGWVVGQDETILATRDGGRTWQKQRAESCQRPFNLRDRFRSVCFVDRRQGWIVGERGTLLQTDDGGGHWKRRHLPIPDELSELLELRDVSFADPQTGWLVGLLGSVIWRTEDGGQSWKAESTGYRGGLYAVRAMSRNRVCAVGERGARLLSEDGGRTWNVRQAQRRPTWLYITPHDHHLKGWSGLMAATADHVDWVVVRPGRGAFYFEPYLELYPQRWQAGTSAVGAVYIREWNEYLNSRRRAPHYIHHAYQVFGGTDHLARRTTALLRLLQPEVVFIEWPVFAEGYGAWETGLVARCARQAYFAAPDPQHYRELSQLGLQPWQPAQLFTEARWYNDAFGLRPTTHVLRPRDGKSARLASRREAVMRSAASWEGLMDRGFPQIRAWIAPRRVHLLHQSRERHGITDPTVPLEIETETHP